MAMVEILKEKENVTDDIEIRIIGSKPGEKLYEELINEEEVRRTIEIDNYFAVLPAFKSVFKEIEYDYGGDSSAVDKIYRSDKENIMSVETLKQYLTDNDLV